MIASTGMYICNIAYIPINWKDICIADMNELYEMASLRTWRYKKWEEKS